ncbi:MAG TPA: amidohydrolase family protein [Propionibacteriaceae bacterium]
MTLTATERDHRTALRAAWLFDGTGTLRRDPVVLVEGSRIVSVECGAPAPDDAAVVDLGEATLLPGLVDTHVHLAFDASPDPVAALGGRSDEEVLASMREAGRTALNGGVTTVRDLGDRGYLSLALRGEEGMPTVLAAGPPITVAAGHCHFLGGVAGAGVDGVRDAVREHVERGVDVIKIMATGGQLTPGSQQHQAQFSAEELQAAAHEAHRWGLPITAHAHGTAGIENAVAAGVDGLEHASFWSEDGVDDPGELVDRIVAQRIVVGATVGLVPVPGMMGPPEILKRIPAIVANMQRMHRAGVRVVAGSDAGIAPVKPHDVLRYAMPQLIELGMTPAEVLRTITSVAADVIRLGDRKGRIAAGYDADVLAVGGNPLTEPESIHRIVAVYSRGRRVTT